jgi:hypothetical protein
MSVAASADGDALTVGGASGRIRAAWVFTHASGVL